MPTECSIYFWKCHSGFLWNVLSFCTNHWCCSKSFKEIVINILMLKLILLTPSKYTGFCKIEGIVRLKMKILWFVLLTSMPAVLLTRAVCLCVLQHLIGDVVYPMWTTARLFYCHFSYLFVIKPFPPMLLCLDFFSLVLPRLCRAGKCW